MITTFELPLELQNIIHNLLLIYSIQNITRAITIAWHEEYTQCYDIGEMREHIYIQLPFDRKVCFNLCFNTKTSHKFESFEYDKNEYLLARGRYFYNNPHHGIVLCDHGFIISFDYIVESDLVTLFTIG